MAESRVQGPIGGDATCSAHVPRSVPVVPASSGDMAVSEHAESMRASCVLSWLVTHGYDIRIRPSFTVRGFRWLGIDDSYACRVRHTSHVIPLSPPPNLSSIVTILSVGSSQVL